MLLLLKKNVFRIRLKSSNYKYITILKCDLRVQINNSEGKKYAPRSSRIILFITNSAFVEN